ARRVTGCRPTALHAGPTTVAGSVGDAARVPALTALRRRYQGHLTKQCTEHHIHLHVRERGPRTTPGPTTERDPLVQVGFRADEPVRVEDIRVGEQRLVTVDQFDTDHHVRALG